MNIYDLMPFCKTELYCSTCNKTYQCFSNTKPNYVAGPCLHFCPECTIWEPVSITTNLDTKFTEQVTMVGNTWEELKYNE